MEILGFTFYDIEGKLYMKAMCVVDIASDAGKGVETVPMVIDPSQREKFVAASYPARLTILRQAGQKKKDKSGNAFLVTVVTDCKLDPVAPAVRQAA